MFNHTKLAKRPKQFLSITGLTIPQFDSLSKEIQKQYKTTETIQNYRNNTKLQKQYKTTETIQNYRNNTKLQKQYDYPKKKEHVILVQDANLIIPSKTES